MIGLNRYYLLLLLILIGGCEESDKYLGLSPSQALSTFELDSEFKIELIAAEPLVSDPIDMSIDEDGRLYVVEMHGYPLDKSGTDRIMLLNDTNGDGQMDKSVVFADSLVFPMGVMAWKKGILVTEPPNVWYMEDSDRDGHADVKQKILTGFDASDPESNVNNPMFGLDNWIYLANGPMSNSDIFYPDQPKRPLILHQATNRDVRFQPDRHKLETLSNNTQFGFTFDQWGHQISVSNRNHIFQKIIARRYLERNPDLLVSSAMQSISDHGSAAEVFPITKNPNPQLLTDIGEFTASTGITYYNSGTFPAAFDNVSFVAEPAHNLVHADRIKSNGPRLSASRLRAGKEFLASTDAWFRPVNMYIGPDGALYIVDYYRQIIEGPEWMSNEVLQSGDLYNGSTMGRIYRVTPKGSKKAQWSQKLQLSEATNKQLVKKLADPNIWWRRTAQRLLVDRDDTQLISALAQLAQNDTSAVGRLHALWTLQGLESVTPALIRKALQDSVAGIRENAIKLAELHLKNCPALKDPLTDMQSDPDPAVRYQLLLTLGYVDTPEAAEVRQALLFEDIDNK